MIKKKGSTETLSALVGIIIFTMVVVALGILAYKYLIIPSGLEKTLEAVGEKIETINDQEMLVVAGNSGPPEDYIFLGFDADKNYFGRTFDEMGWTSVITGGWQCRIEPDLNVLGLWTFYTEIKKPKVCRNKPCICFCPTGGLSIFKYANKDMCESRQAVCKVLNTPYDLSFAGRNYECEYGPFIASRHSNVIEFNIQRSGDTIGVCQFPPCLMGTTRSATSTINDLYDKFLSCRSYNQTDCYCDTVNFYFLNHQLKINSQDGDLIFKLSDYNKVISTKKLESTELCFSDKDYNVLEKNDLNIPFDLGQTNYFKILKSNIANFRIYKPSTDKICIARWDDKIYQDKPSCSGKAYNENLKINKAIFIDWIKKESFNRVGPWYGLVDLLYRSNLWYFYVLENPEISDENAIKNRINYMNNLYNYKNLDTNNNSLIGDDSIYIGINSYQPTEKDERKIKNIEKNYIEIIYNPASKESEIFADLIKKELDEIKGKYYVGFKQEVTTPHPSYKADIEVMKTIIPEDDIKKNVWMFCQGDYQNLKACQNNDHILMPAVVLYVVDMPDGRNIENIGHTISKSVYDALIKYFEPITNETVPLVAQ